MVGATLGARDFSRAVSSFCQVFIVTRAKSSLRARGFSRGFAARGFDTENSRLTREKPLVRKVSRSSNKNNTEDKPYEGVESRVNPATFSSKFF